MRPNQKNRYQEYPLWEEYDHVWRPEIKNRVGLQNGFHECVNFKNFEGQIQGYLPPKPGGDSDWIDDNDEVCFVFVTNKSRISKAEAENLGLYDAIIGIQVGCCMTWGVDSDNCFWLERRNKGNKRYGEGGFGHRRALMEEAQEVKAVFHNPSTGRTDSGQVALDSVRQNSDLYRQLASRYILIGHSMGGVVSREYVQGNFYNGDVDKIITLNTPHEGTGALNMQCGMLFFCLINRRRILRG
ncbi:triacylglycerol lipase [Fibrobacter sp. UWH5]|uniref:esterase/lipase family protein n=1 Tax=Fibrobacter sp. UWH5 TaxID=1896211 RepID=UPI000934F7D4|nr:alpha/beta hydrolase [Fibrobacter sp. UWH5]